MDGKRCICKSEIKMAASKHVTKLEVNGVQLMKTRPRDHTFTSGLSQQHLHNLITGYFHKTCNGDALGGHSFVVKRGRELCRATKAHLKVRSSQCHRGHPKRVAQSPQHISRIVKYKHQETLNLQSTHKRGNHS